MFPSVIPLKPKPDYTTVLIFGFPHYYWLQEDFEDITPLINRCVCDFSDLQHSNMYSYFLHQMLVPATAEDLRKHGQITINPSKQDKSTASQENWNGEKAELISGKWWLITKK